MDYKNIFSSIYDTYGFGGEESRSGPGSTLYETERLREKIKNLVKYRNLKSVVDIPCGDFNWMKEIVDSFEEYHGGDIVPACIEENNKNYSSEKIKFSVIDLLENDIPESDLLIVRDVIGHYPLESGAKIIENILKSKSKYLLSTTWYNVIDKEYHKKHINKDVGYGRFYPVNLMSEPFNLPEPEMIIEEDVIVEDYNLGNRKTLSLWNLDEIRQRLKMKNSVTIVTGLWDIGRENLNEGWSRSFDHYLEKFSQLLSVDVNMIIFGDEELEKFVNLKRKKENTQFIRRNLSWFKENKYFDLIQSIRKDPKWYNQSSWLQDSTQCKLEMYNPLVMSKMFLLHDAKIVDKFNSSHLVWVDAGITNTVHIGYFTHDLVLSKIKEKLNKFSFISFPYDGKVEIHGFEYEKICEYSDSEVNMVCRGGFFGGPKDSISNVNGIYYNLLIETLSKGLMGTEESVFTIMAYKHPELIQYFEIENNGLLGKFFENVKTDNLLAKQSKIIFNKGSNLNLDKVALYVITFNSPRQFKTLIDSMLSYDGDFINKPIKYLLNNSTDRNTDEEYKKIAKDYDFTIIWPKENLGITGGRQFIANHFESLELDFYFFFEDDMFFFDKKDGSCKNGFTRYTPNLYQKSLEIIDLEKFDFLKLNFSEFFGDNSTQWSWYNVPQIFREQHWPNNKKLPKMGLDPNAPRTQFKEIKSHKGVPYASGEIYLCNWPIVLTKEGNHKCYLKTVYASPFEQTLMSHNYQETIKGNLKPGLLLMTPTEHNRFDHYDSSLRKEC
jgi:hypothetical protein